MRKLSKKERTKIKEKEIKRIKKMAEEGVPYSRHKIRVCRHFTGSGGGIIVGFAQPTLVRISEDKCMCIKCRREFPAEFIEEMEMLTRAYANAGCCDVSLAERELNKRCKPVKYYFIGSDEIRYVDDIIE